MFSEALGYLGRSPSAEKHVRKVLVMEACERPKPQDKVEDPVVFADMIANLASTKDGGPLSFGRDTCAVFTREARDGLYTRDKAERFRCLATSLKT